MAEMPQSFQNHARSDPAFQVLLGLALLSLIVGIVALVRQPGLTTTALVLLAITLSWNSLITRRYSLKVQDRVIRLEERLRLAMLLAETDKPCISGLTKEQLVALRFASDAELPVLAVRASKEKLSNKQIKAAIQTWRADMLRV